MRTPCADRKASNWCPPVVPAIGALLLLLAAGCCCTGPVTTEEEVVTEEWESLFDGQTLDRWRVTEFGGQGEVTVEDEAITLDYGAADMTGITYLGPIPRMNYEVRLEAMRVDGNDFFCGLTFPVDQSCCSLIVGGWGGTLVGISSFDDLDASQNETTKFMEFEDGRWYSIRVRITPGRIEARIDDKQVVDVRPGDRRISVRAEVELSQPFGIAAWNTRAALRDIRVRPLKPAVKPGG